MSGTKVNDKHKDALFKIVFGDHPKYALSLYNAINGTDYTNTEDLEITTLKDAVYIGIKNDVSFLFNHDMNLYEHQSTYCPNMPLRGLGYFADLYQIYLGGGDLARAIIYDKRLVEIPAPKYYVFYNGKEEQPEVLDLHLSSAYKGDGDIEIIAHMINVNSGCNKELMEHCKPLSDYSEFVSRVREYKSEGLSKEESVKAAIDSCLEDGILTDVLRKERAKVANALYTALTEEEIEWLRNYQRERDIRERERDIRESREEGLAEGREEGITQARLEDVECIVASGMADAEKACEVIGVNIEDYKEYKSSKERQ